MRNVMEDGTHGERRLAVWSWLGCRFESEASRPAQRRFIRWTFLWAVAFVVVTFLLLRGDGTPVGAVAWLLVAVPAVIGVGALVAFVDYLRSTDELMRRIQLEGLGIAFGFALLFVFGYQLAIHAGAPRLDLAPLSMILVGAWVVGQLVAIRRYR